MWQISQATLQGFICHKYAGNKSILGDYFMTLLESRAHGSDRKLTHVDVLIVGAGISGLGAAYHLLDQMPEKSFAILEAKDDFGGTWRTHRYPGIRSDSSLYTLGYRFKPWLKNPIASAEQILTYLDEVIEENKLDEYIHYSHRIEGASWSSDDQRWTISANNTKTNESVNFTANFVWMCQGYYNHDQPYTPEWEGMDRFSGQIVHPQLWPDDIDLSGKRVVVIGSGATAATLVPNIADDCAHVTMLQRSPTFFSAGPNRNELADSLRELDIPEEWIHEIVRRKGIHDSDVFQKMAKEQPEAVRQQLLEAARAQLPDDVDVDKHFNPSYRPWQQRLALIPDGDLFKTISEGKASVVTDQIKHFDETGIALESGDHLEADVIITATGFDLLVLGGVQFEVDGNKVDLADTVTYRGIMFTGLPNLAYVFGYFRSSWTLRADIISDFVCRLFRHMEAKGATAVVPALREHEREMKLGPWVDPENFNPGYLTRSMHLMARQGEHQPWIMMHEYVAEREVLANADLDDGTLLYS